MWLDEDVKPAGVSRCVRGQNFCRTISRTFGTAEIRSPPSKENAAVLTAVRSPHKVTESIEICSVGFQKKPKRQNDKADTAKTVSAVYI